MKHVLIITITEETAGTGREPRQVSHMLSGNRTISHRRSRCQGFSEQRMLVSMKNDASDIKISSRSTDKVLTTTFRAFQQHDT